MGAAWWYANRSAGLVAWALLAASMVVGLLLSGKVLGKRVRPNWLQDLHRGLSGLSLAFVGVHVAAAIGDSYVHFGAADVLVPGVSSWRTWAIAWGIVSMYLFVAVEVSSLMRAKLPRHLWRKLHYLSFPLFLTATAHAVTAGTEMGTTTGIAVASLVTATIAGLTAMRAVDEIEKAKRPPVAARIPAAATVRPASTLERVPQVPATPYGTPVEAPSPYAPPTTTEPPAVRAGSPF